MTDYRDVPLVDVTAVIPLPEQKLAVAFEDGRAGVFDMAPYLSRPAWESLNDPGVFERVTVRYGTVAWPGNVDMAPDLLYSGVIETRAADKSAA